MPTPSSELASLLLKWQERRRLGKPVSADQLCAKLPHFLAPLKQQIAAVESMERMLGGVVTIDPQSPTISVQLAPSAEQPTGEYRADASTLPQPNHARLGSTAPLAPLGYKVLSELGRGGMGVVYKALQIKAKRVVALKMILSGGHASKGELERFRIEGESVARLHHPNIVQVYDVGDHDGKPYFALEFCEGGNLAGKLAGTPLPACAAAALVEKLARAIAEAHDEGIIHRDLKPANVLLTNHGEPKITDFGLAKHFEPIAERAGYSSPLTEREANKTSPVPREELTQTGAVMGTPSYMAPEQATGDAKRVGPTCDVYALGAILYECLTGRPPFKGASLVETLDQVRKQEPVPPMQLNPKVPRDLETICLKCLRKEPENRYRGARELADDLRCMLDGRPIVARPVGSVERLAKWTRRNRVLAVSGLLVATSLVVGTTVSITQAIRASRNATQANRLAAKEKEQRDRAENLAESEAQEKAKAHQQLVRSFRDQGHRLVELDDRFGAALAYSQALSLTQQPDLSADLRTQIAAALHGMPRLLRFDDLGAPISHVSINPEGTQIVAGTMTQDGQVAIVGLGTSSDIRLRHGSPVIGTAFGPNGRYFATASTDGLARVWDARSGQPMGEAIRHPGGIRRIFFDGDALVTVGGTVTPLRWEAATGKPQFDPNDLVVATEMVTVTEKRAHLVKLPDGRQETRETSVAVPVFLARQQHKADPTRFGLRDVVAVGPKYTLERSEQGLVYLLPNGPDHIKRRILNEIAVPAVHATARHDGKQVALAMANGEVRLFDVTDAFYDAPRPNPFRVVTTHADGATHVAFSPNGLFLVSSGANRDAHIHILSEDKTPKLPIDKPDDRPMPIGKSTVKPDDRPPSEGKASPVEPPSRPALPLFQLFQRGTASGGILLPHPHTVNLVEVSPDGNYVLTASEDQSARIWDLATGQPLTPPLRHAAAVRVAAWMPSSRTVVTGGEDGVLKIWDVSGLPGCDTLIRHGDEVNFVAFSRDGGDLVTLGDDGRAQFWDAVTGRPRDLKCQHEPRTPVRRAAFTSDGNLLATAGDDHTVRVIDTRTGREIHVLRHEAGLRHVKFSVDGSRLLTVVQDGTSIVWDMKTLKQLLIARDPHLQTADTKMNDRPTEQPAPIQESRRDDNAHNLRADISSDGRRIVTAGIGPHARVWDVATGAMLFSLSSGGGTTFHAEFSPDNAKIVTASTHGTQIWSAVDGRPLSRLLQQGGAVYDARFSPRGDRIVTAGMDGTARIWTVNGEAVGQPMMHSRYVHRAWFSADGARVLTVSADAARVWNATTSQPLTPPLRHGVEVTWAAFDASETRVATAGRDGTARVWKLSPPDPRPSSELVEIASRASGQKYTENGVLAPFLESRPGRTVTITPQVEMILNAPRIESLPPITPKPPAKMPDTTSPP